MKIAILLFALAPMVAFASAPSPEAAASDLWRSLSHGPGQGGDGAAVRGLFHADAMVYGGRYKEGAPVFSAQKASEFMESVATPRENAFYECEVTREVRRYDRFATV
ncbi:hypothetical protein, partial [Massilia cavernae]